MYQTTELLLRSKLGDDGIIPYQKASEIIYQFGYEETDESIELFIIGYADELGDDCCLELAMDSYYSAVQNIINDFSISLTNDPSLNFMNYLVIALTSLEEYDDVDSIKNILTLDLTNEEMIAELCSLTGTLASDDFLEYICKVDSSLISRIREKSEYGFSVIPSDLSIASQEEDIENNKEIIKKLKNAVNKINDNHIVAVKFIKSGAQIGLHFDNYVKLLIEDILLNDPGFITENLYLLAAMSVDGYLDPVTLVQNKINDIFPDPIDSAPIYHKLREISMKVNQNG